MHSFYSKVIKKEILLIIVLLFLASYTQAEPTAETEEVVAATVEGSHTLHITIPPGVELDVEALLEDILMATLDQYPEIAEAGFQVTEKPGILVLEFSLPVPEAAQRIFLDALSPFQAVFAGPVSLPADCVTTQPDRTEALAAASKVLPSVAALQGDNGNFGTGFIISPDGYIMTNAHVVQGEETFEITLYDGRRLQGRKVGYVEDINPDVGVIKVEAINLPAVEFSNPATLRCGDPLLLIGHPGGYGYWVITSGQFLQQDGTDLITTVPSAQGGSGSPLITMRGQVVGLLWGIGGHSEGETQATPPNVVEVLWTWEVFHALKVQTSNSVTIDKAHALAEVIIARHANLITGSLAAESICTPSGASAQITVPRSLIPVLSLSDSRGTMDFILPFFDPTPILLDVQQVASNIIFTFNQPLVPAVCEQLFKTFLSPLTPFNPLPVLEPTPAPEPSTTPHPQNALALAAAKRVLPSVVVVQGVDGLKGSDGTGSIISSDGYILTNQHVVVNNLGQGYTTFQITLYDGRILPGRLVGYVENGTPDLAVIKVEASGLPAIEFGDSSMLRAGQSLLVIGHPGTYGDWIVTGGEFLRTKENNVIADIPTAQGNSGGPIINLKGEMVALLWGAYIGDEVPTEIKPNPARIIWGFPEFFSLSKDNTAGVAINTVRTLVNAIIARQGNVP